MSDVHSKEYKDSLKCASTILKKKNDYAKSFGKALNESSKSMDARLMVSSVLAKSNEESSKLCLFDESELRVGALLGTGGFCDVFEIGEIKLKGSSALDEQNMHLNGGDGDLKFDLPDGEEFEWTRELMSKRVTRGDSTRFAIKVIKDNLLNIRSAVEKAEAFITAVMDLAIEARYLSVVSHPNIIRVRGFAKCDPFSGGYFIVMDRLNNTLTDQIDDWNRRVSNSTGLKGLCCGGEPIQDVWEEQLMAAYGLASALNHMHSQKMIYRDLKPDNAGFDVRGDIKIFDFGLATELYTHLEVEDGLYKLTAETGSLRYMAPEVRLGLPYNCKADVHSFGIVFWQICSTIMPYATLSQAQFQDNVLKGGLRPSKQSWWPNRDNVFSKMKSCWEVESSKRTDLSVICKWLSGELSVIRGEEEDSTRKKLESRRSRKSILVGMKASDVSMRGSGHFEV